jgi:hypothetical protein
MNYTFSVLVVAERFQRQCSQVRFFFREHGGNLAFGGAMDARVGPAFFTAVEIPLRFLQARITTRKETVTSNGSIAA